MCGICGVLALGPEPIRTDCLKSMVDIIAHRGPDDAGYLVAREKNRRGNDEPAFRAFADRRFASIFPRLPLIDTPDGQAALDREKWDLFFGFRRLSIIDLSASGHQPMASRDNRFWIVYNGEVYNFKELRRELEALGHEFRSASDTEVILCAYMEWGVECLSRLNGMFAFALWDSRRNRVFIARDRYGIKPLYYALLENGTFIFGSEVKSILEYRDYTKDIDHEALIEYFTFQNIFTDRTLYRGIKILPAGHLMEIDLSSESGSMDYSISKKQYWDFNFCEPAKPLDEREYIEELDRLFVQAVQRQLVSDVEIGSYLSGGMDSGSITAIAARHFPFLKTFTVGFDLHTASGIEMGFDEREKSEYMSYLFKTEHYEMVLKSGDMERILPQFAWHLEEPRVGQSYPNYYASKLASKFVKVVLAGTGGDELFGGYPWRYYRAVVNENFEDYIDKYYLYWQRLLPNREIKKVFAPIWDKVSHVWTRDIFKDVFTSHAEQLTRPEDYINHSLYFEAKTFLHGLLVVEDKLSMAHSLETRVPFLDNDIVDFAMKVPMKMKLENLSEAVKFNENVFGPKKQRYFEKTKDGKLILRKVMGKHIPEEITSLEKQGFAAPDNSWFRGDSIDFVKKTIWNERSRIYNYFDRKSVRILLDEHFSGQKNRRLLIWSLLNFEAWCERFGF